VGVQLRLFANGTAGLQARLGARIDEAADLESPAVPEQDFNEFLHGLRSRELERLPPGAGTVLHGGAAGAWYFEWFEDRYPTPVRRHIGVEAFSPAPDPLPPRVEWHQQTLGDLSPVADGSVDLVFAGEVLEHLWPEDVAGFLAEAHRVLRSGGRIAADSPNRLVTTMLEWDHPEHTVEFTVAEIREVLQLAGFEDIEIRGVWICFDHKRDRVLPLDELGRVAGWDAERRAAEAGDRPEDSFVWWAEGRRADRPPDREALNGRVQEAYEIYRARRVSRMHHTVGARRERGGHRLVTGRRGQSGHLLFGPYVPMRPGKWVARFRLAARPPRWRGRPSPDEPLGTIDVVVGESEPRVVAERPVTVRELPLDGEEHELELPFELERTEFGAQFRVTTLGRVRMSARYPVEVE
jgi:SAM-dependent methyltransferase